MSLVEEIEAYCARNSILVTVFAIHAMEDRTFVRRLREIGEDRMRSSTIHRCKDYMTAHPKGGDCPKIKERAKPERKRKAVVKLRSVVDESNLVRVDSRACWNCGASGYTGCGCHREGGGVTYLSTSLFPNLLSSPLAQYVPSLDTKTARSSSAKVETGLASTARLGGTQ